MKGILNVFSQQFYNLVFADFVVVVTSVCGDGKSRGHGDANEIHLGKVRTLATEFVAHICAAFGLTCTEGVNPFTVFHSSNIIIF